MLSLDTHLQPNDDEVIGRVLDGEAILVNLATGSYYAIPDIGGFIWQAIEERCSLREIAARVSASYDVSADQAGADVLQLAERLLGEGLVAAAGASAAAGTAPAAPAIRLPYVPPQMTAYSDMRNLLALDPPMPSVDALAGGKSEGSGSNEL